ncbi:hypothetical protein PPERSA_09677 [Pseudocohnilembus persalinus]|uniref:Uncharacterized protein n=1 Tax=Pseudocohnilembus persalinus TaxID=266149 RepID=A0A0V0R7S3_PSEPJ|nr:hypothetical protein PPERSA_09677 [Pseudocohnilembus persalinus]|eukprot:KRX10293.1 hypothetical protein PPERSA_09677 [Pseudocohnilembus persalinus]
MNQSFNSVSSRQSSRLKKNQKVSLPEETEDLEQYVEILLDHQKTCEKTGKYIEAEMAKRRLSEIKKELEKRNKNELKFRHISEKSEIERAHVAEFNEFNQFWDEKMREFDEDALKVEEQTIERQQIELQQFVQELERSIPLAPKDTAEQLNLKKMEESLAKQQEYMEAHKVQQQILALEKDEYQKWIHQRQKKIQNLVTQLQTRQKNELNALRQRIQSGQEEQRKVRSLELEKLLQKYQNVRKELDASQTSEASKLEKSMKQGSVMNASRMINSSRMSNNSSMIRGSSRK